MFKPLKKSLHYVLVFPSLLAIFLTAHHPRMGKVPLDPSGIVTKGFTTNCHQRGTLVMWNLSSSMFVTVNCHPHKQKFDSWHHLSCVFPENVSHLTTALWWGLHWFIKVLSEEWLLFCILLIKSTPIKFHFIWLESFDFLCHVTSGVHIVMEEFQIYTYPKLCIVNLNSN